MHCLVDFCRLCLASKAEFSNMWLDDIMEKVTSCISELDFDSNLPSLICTGCLDKVEDFFEFKSRCLKAEFFINSYLAKLSEVRGGGQVINSLKVDVARNFGRQKAKSNVMLRKSVRPTSQKAVPSTISLDSKSEESSIISMDSKVSNPTSLCNYKEVLSSTSLRTYIKEPGNVSPQSNIDIQSSLSLESNIEVPNRTSYNNKVQSSVSPWGNIEVPHTQTEAIEIIPSDEDDVFIEEEDDEMTMTQSVTNIHDPQNLLVANGQERVLDQVQTNLSERVKLRKRSSKPPAYRFEDVCVLPKKTTAKKSTGNRRVTQAQKLKFNNKVNKINSGNRELWRSACRRWTLQRMRTKSAKITDKPAGSRDDSVILPPRIKTVEELNRTVKANSVYDFDQKYTTPLIVDTFSLKDVDQKSPVTDTDVDSSYTSIEEKSAACTNTFILNPNMYVMPFKSEPTQNDPLRYCQESSSVPDTSHFIQSLDQAAPHYNINTTNNIILIGDQSDQPETQLYNSNFGNLLNHYLQSAPPNKAARGNCSKIITDRWYVKDPTKTTTEHHNQKNPSSASLKFPGLPQVIPLKRTSKRKDYRHFPQNIANMLKTLNDKSDEPNATPNYKHLDVSLAPYKGNAESAGTVSTDNPQCAIVKFRQTKVMPKQTSVVNQPELSECDKPVINFSNIIKVVESPPGSPHNPSNNAEPPLDVADCGDNPQVPSADFDIPSDSSNSYIDVEGISDDEDETNDDFDVCTPLTQKLAVEQRRIAELYRRRVLKCHFRDLYNVIDNNHKGTSSVVSILRAAKNCITDLSTESLMLESVYFHHKRKNDYLIRTVEQMKEIES